MTQGARVLWPLNKFTPDAEGTPVVDGASQSGTTLNIRGMQSGSVIRDGQFFTASKGTNYYLHMNVGNVTVPANGEVSLTIEPPLRMVTEDASPCFFEQPFIEGFFPAGDYSWLERLDNYAEFSLTVKERA